MPCTPHASTHLSSRVCGGDACACAEQQGLLNQNLNQTMASTGRSGRGGTNAAWMNVAAGGVKVEGALERVGLSWQILFFVSSLGVMFGAIVGALGAFGTFELAALVDEIFLL